MVPSGATPTISPMFSVELVCSSEGCELTIEAVGLDIDRLEALVCDDCGCCLQIVSVSYAETVCMPARADLPLAA